MHELLERVVVDLRHDRDGTGLDVGEDRVEQSARALHVLARPEGFLKIRKQPDDGLVSSAFHDFLDAPLHHPDVQLARHDLGRAGTKDEPVRAFESLERGPRHD